MPKYKLGLYGPHVHIDEAGSSVARAAEEYGLCAVATTTTLQRLQTKRRVPLHMSLLQLRFAMIVVTGKAKVH